MHSKSKILNNKWKIFLKDKKKKETVFALHIEPAELQTDGDI